MARTSTAAKKTPAKAPAKKTAEAPAPAAKKTTKAPVKPGLTEDQRLNALEQRVEVLESERPGRKPRPLLAIRQRDVCAIDPQSDSTVCPYASIYRYQSGCHGAKCRLKQHEAYERRKGNSRGTAVAAPAKKVAKKATPAPAKKATVTKKPVSKKVAA